MTLSYELHAIAQAIEEGLKPNPVKDYIFPVATAMFSAALGAWAANHTVNVQEWNKRHVQNVDTLNETILAANDVRNNLMAIKGNYHGNITCDPIQRLLAVPPIVLNSSPVRINIPNLAFLAPDKVENSDSRWLRVELIDALFSNYNNVISLWMKRNEELISVMPALFKLHSSVISSAQVSAAIGPGRLALLSDLTEMAILHTDDLLVEISCFLLGFPVVTKKQIPPKILKKHRKLLMIHLPDEPGAVDLLSLVPELDFASASRLHGVPTTELQARYRRVYLR